MRARRYAGRSCRIQPEVCPFVTRDQTPLPRHRAPFQKAPYQVAELEFMSDSTAP